jgi:hypothetical protein
MPKNIVNIEGKQKRFLIRNQKNSAPSQINPVEFPIQSNKISSPPDQQRSSGPALNQILPSEPEQKKSDKEENLINQPNENPLNTNSQQTTPNKKRVKPTTPEKNNSPTQKGDGFIKVKSKKKKKQPTSSKNKEIPSDFTT